MKILYIAGPGDVISTFGYWKKGESDPTESNVTYSGQFFSFCKKNDAEGYVVSAHRDEKLIKWKKFIVEHQANFLDKEGGVLYHIGQLKAGFRIVFKALSWKANYVVISSGTHWFLLWPLVLFGIKVIPTIHCVLWPKYKHRKVSSRVIGFFNGLFFKYGAYEIMSASKEISRQLMLSGVKNEKIHEFLPLYLKTRFNEIKPAQFSDKPFRIIYIGRVERVKGVFDLLNVFYALIEKGLNLELDYCGTGTDFSDLKNKTESNSLVRCHGHCNKEKLLSIINESHVFVVPTTTGFVEGFNQVVVEGVLSGRPVVTSDVCPAMEYVLPAVMVSEPDNLDSYAANIKELYENEDLFHNKVNACLSLNKDFYNEKYSWGRALQKILSK